MTKEIRLTQGKVALVDDADFDWLNQFKWCAHRDCNTFYAKRAAPTVNGKRGVLYMHALLVGKGCDHKDGNGLNNQRNNLRPATTQQNNWNRGAHKNSTSPFNGVSWNKSSNKWQAHIGFNGKKQHLGYFHDEVEAAQVWDAAACEYFGGYARLNFPLPGEEPARREGEE
jgi:hypothetical protein